VANIVQKPQGTSRPPEADFTFCGAKDACLPQARRLCALLFLHWAVAINVEKSPINLMNIITSIFKKRIANKIAEKGIGVFFT
jgi:hypothetical protein